MADTLLEAPPLYDPAAETVRDNFVDRRIGDADGSVVRERRQFTNSHDSLSGEAAELAQAIDSYKARHRRRFINYDEMLGVIKSLGYSR